MPVGLRGYGLVSGAIDKARQTQSVFREVGGFSSKPRVVSLSDIDVRSGSVKCCAADEFSDSGSEASFGAPFMPGFETDDGTSSISDMSSISSVSSISSFGCAIEEGYFHHFMNRENSEWDDDNSSVSSVSTIGPHSFSNPAFMSLITQHELDPEDPEFHNAVDIAKKKRKKTKKRKKKKASLRP